MRNNVKMWCYAGLHFKIFYKKIMFSQRRRELYPQQKKYK